MSWTHLIASRWIFWVTVSLSLGGAHQGGADHPAPQVGRGDAQHQGAVGLALVGHRLADVAPLPAQRHRRPADAAGVHLLLVSRRDNEAAFSPTPENIHAGDYPLRLPFCIVFRPEKTAVLLPMLRFLLGDEVAANLAAAEFVPVPANARKQVLRDLAAR